MPVLGNCLYRSLNFAIMVLLEICFVDGLEKVRNLASHPELTSDLTSLGLSNAVLGVEAFLEAFGRSIIPKSAVLECGIVY
jgi:hypothetical protein